MSGNMSSLTGELTITRPNREPKEYSAELLAAAAKDGVTLPPLTQEPDGLSEKALEAITKDDNNIVWWLILRSENICFEMEEAGRQHLLERDIRLLINHIKEDNCVANGEIIFSTYDNEYFRIRVENNNITQEQAKIVWPDGSTFR